jgi:hypothetical protein
MQQSGLILTQEGRNAEDLEDADVIGENGSML